jgi:uncharacterized protein
MQLPSDEVIQQLHHTYAPSEAAFQLVFTHCKVVDAIAQQLIQTSHLQVDRDLVHVGCMLHDIGVYELLDMDGLERKDIPYITHGIRGEAILKKEGYSTTIWRFASHHTGVGLTKEDVIQGKLPLPVADYEPNTPEEELVMYADKFHSKSTPPQFNSFATYRDHVIQFGEDKAKLFDALADRLGIPDLTKLSEQYHYAIK